jgi:hypothetical protein
MKTKPRWKGALLTTMALILALSLAVVGAPGPKQANEAEGANLVWFYAEGFPPLILPMGAGAILDVAVVGGTDTVFVLCDQGLGAGAVVVYRSDDGGYSFGVQTDLGFGGGFGLNVLAGSGLEEGVAVVASPNYSVDGTVFVLTNDTGVVAPGAGYVYSSNDKGVTFGAAGYTTVAVPAATNCLAVDPNFNSRLSGGTIVVGTVFMGVTSVFMETWQSPVIGWTGAWTAVAVNPLDTPDTLALCYAPTSSVRLIAVMNDNLGIGINQGIWGVTGSIITGFPQLLPAMPVPGVTNDGVVWIHASTPGGVAGSATNAVIALGTDYDPVSTPACPNCPMYFFVGTDGTPAGAPGPPNVSSSTFWFDPLTSPGTFAMVDLKSASTLPAIHWATSGLAAQGMYSRAQLLAGSANAPVTYTYDVGVMAWDNLVRIAGDGGPIGTLSNNVGVKLAYGGSGSQVHAITTEIPASAYGITLAAQPPTAGDLTCLSISDNYGGSWSDTALTQENFRLRIVDTLWIDAATGFIVCDDTALAPGRQSVFKTWMYGMAWKRVDRWQGVQRITISADEEAILLLDTGMTGGKVLVSSDDGESFLPTSSDPVSIVTIMMTCIAAGSADDIFVGDWNGHIYVSHDGGVTWTDSGQVAAAIKSLAVPRFYNLAQHVLAGVDTLAGMNQGTLVSKDDGASWTSAGAGWLGGGFGILGHIEVKFSPMYNGTTENIAYCGINGSLGGGMHRADLSAPGVWTSMAVPNGPISNFDIIRDNNVTRDGSANENILYALQLGTNLISATYYPELCTATIPLWRFDAVAPVLWQATGAAATWGMDPVGTPGGTNIPCPFDTVLNGGVTLLARDNSGIVGQDAIANITETTAFLTPVVKYSPADGVLVPSNNLATGEPVEYQWTPVAGATSYDVTTVTDTTNPATILGAASAAGVGVTVFSVPVGTLVDGQTYYWRVRVASTTAVGDHTGPWSEWFSYSVEVVEMHGALTLFSPESGAVGVPQRPMFRWSGVEDVETTEFQLSTSASYLSLIADETFGMQQTYSYPEDLDYETVYHWRVRVGGGSGIDAWMTPWAEGVFTTMEEEVEPTPEPTPTPVPPVIIEEVGPETPAWVWALIVIGAVLAIVVIVLIMRTRRPV